MPELRRSPLFARVFLSSRTAALDLALAALLLALTRRAPLAALGALPYAARLLRDARRRARGRSEAVEVLAADLSADLIGLGALIRGSAREPEPCAVSSPEPPITVLTVGNMYPPHHLGGAELIWRRRSSTCAGSAGASAC